MCVAGLEGDVIALPSQTRKGGDLYALFSCGHDRFARVVLADCVGHGFVASQVAEHVHRLLHRHSNVRDPSDLLAELNDTFISTAQAPGEPLRLTTVVTATYDRRTHEFNYAYAAHPRMLEWHAKERRWRPIGEGLDGLPLGVFSGEAYSEQSIRLDAGDLVLAFSDALTEVRSPEGDLLSTKGFLELAEKTMTAIAQPPSLHDFSESLLEGIRRYHGSEELSDDVTLLTLRSYA